MKKPRPSASMMNSPIRWTKELLRKTIRKQFSSGLFLVVSNREPYLHRFEGEEIVCQTPPGGVTSALDPVMRTCGGVWVAHGSGDADRQRVDAQDHVAVPPGTSDYTLRRVWLSKEEEDGYYYGFANEALWPLSHVAYARPVFNETDWETYRAVNRKFAEVVLQEVAGRQAFVFIQDYHFALLPRFLKQSHIRTAHFWHIPWPNPEAFRICPWGEEILDGLLGNDLLGFHLGHHCQNFLDAIERTLECRIDREHAAVVRGGETTLVRPFPISVDFDEIAAHAATPEVAARRRELVRRHGLQGQLLGVGVDRIDYTKGIPERLLALDRLFTRYPEYHGRVTFVQIGVPSRVHIETYQRLNDDIDRLVETINWKHQREAWRPILYLKGHVDPTTLRAWYRAASFCLVSSLHDGMNLVAKEFVASRVDDDGVLVLSRFTGAARELTDAVLVNPYAVDRLGQAMVEALTMEPAERQRRMRKLRQTVHDANIYQWAGQMLSELFRFEFTQE